MDYFRVPIHVFIQAESPQDAMEQAMELSSFGSGDDLENPRWAQSDLLQVTKATPGEVEFGKAVIIRVRAAKNGGGVPRERSSRHGGVFFGEQPPDASG